jgi:catechol 2,3-dioxygenase-like lactoylglutathione lyase family enzyme
MTTGIRVLGLDHIVLRTTRMDSMIAFYGDVLGCEVERTLPKQIGLVQLRAGSALIDLVAVDSDLGRAGGTAPRPTGNNLDHFCLQVQAAGESQILDCLRDNNVPAGEFEVRYGAEGFGASIYIKDPDGNIIELRPVP